MAGLSLIGRWARCRNAWTASLSWSILLGRADGGVSAGAASIFTEIGQRFLRANRVAPALAMPCGGAAAAIQSDRFLAACQLNGDDLFGAPTTMPHAWRNVRQGVLCGFPSRNRAKVRHRVSESRRHAGKASRKARFGRAALGEHGGLSLSQRPYSTSSCGYVAAQPNTRSPIA